MRLCRWRKGRAVFRVPICVPVLLQIAPLKTALWPAMCPRPVLQFPHSMLRGAPSKFHALERTASAGGGADRLLHSWAIGVHIPHPPT